MEKYIDILMDLADGTLMFIANKEDIKEKILIIYLQISTQI